MSDRYRMAESVGSTHQPVHSYEDLEKHHPTRREDPAKRHYGQIDGHREEFVYSPSGEKMVSKDFFFTVNGGAHVDVPSPTAGYVRRSPAMDRWGTVEIYDGPGQDAQLVARVRHMEPIHVEDGQQIRYGEPLGQQGSKAPPGVRVGLHTHIDFSEGRLDDFKRYFADIDRGGIAPGVYPDSGRSVASDRAEQLQVDESREQAPARDAVGILKQDSRGSEVRELQTALAALGYRGADGQPLAADSDFGRNTDHAVREFQRAHGLEPVDGKVGPDTREALKQAAQRPLVSEATHPNHDVYQAIGQQLPQDTDPKVTANITLQALENGITGPDQLQGVVVRGSDVHLQGPYPGARVSVDMNAPTPDLQAMSDHMRQQTQEQLQEQTRQQQAQQPQTISV